MPKGAKPAPPQQSTLGEMWGKKKTREPDAKVAQDDKMNVDKTGTRVYLLKLARLDAYSGESSKRKQAPSAQSEGKAVQPPKAKKRRVVASEDEDDLPCKMITHIGRLLLIDMHSHTKARCGHVVRSGTCPTV